MKNGHEMITQGNESRSVKLRGFDVMRGQYAVSHLRSESGRIVILIVPYTGLLLSVYYNFPFSDAGLNYDTKSVIYSNSNGMQVNGAVLYSHAVLHLSKRPHNIDITCLARCLPNCWILYEISICQLH